MDNFFQVTLSLLQGFMTNILLFALTLYISVRLGILVCFGSRSKVKIVSAITKFFIWIVRGSPLMLQVMIFWYAPYLLFKINLPSRFLAALLAFAINYSAYFAEIYRGGVDSISIGQYEASKVLGLTRTQTFFTIILPQVVKRIMPSMSNEIITLVKDTSLITIIAIPEILLSAQDFVSAEAIVWPLFYTGVFFLLFNAILTKLFSFIEKKLSYYK